MESLVGVRGWVCDVICSLCRKWSVLCTIRAAHVALCIVYLAL